MTWPSAALVTGAGSGLGLMLAAALSRRGTSVLGPALNVATACLAREFAADGIRFHALHPGRTRTRMASADADLTADEAAARLLAWLDGLPAAAPVGCWETAGNRLPW